MDWDSIKDLIATYGYYAVAVGTMWDQSGLQGFVIAGGVLASVTGHLNPWLVALCGAAGSFASDLLMFSIGRWRARWLERFAKSPKAAMRLTMLQQGLKRWGWALLTLGRFMPWMGRFVPAAAGLRHYPMVPAMLFTVLGSVASGFLFAALGFYAAESMKWLDQYMLYIGLGALVLSVPVAIWMLKRFDRMVEKRMGRARARALANWPRTPARRLTQLAFSHFRAAVAFFPRASETPPRGHSRCCPRGRSAAPAGRQ